MGCDCDSVADPLEAVKRKDRANAWLLGFAVLRFDLAKIIVAQEETAACRSGQRNNVALPRGRHRLKGGVLLEQELHFPIQTAAESLAAATQSVAFGANVVEHAVRESKKQWNRRGSGRFQDTCPKVI